ncbi:adenylate/guanylate cyclase domain-containing protein [Microcoleus sp. FACHB-672]|uniref:adenylate/guanylate cyclase domain-containing protein n=1 Tax=Microcoleus sp. FACHB-672 TaxID=2692825 RepID=UPI0016853FDB|nr:adenylate/guanylate cyclase domain-containing protein [Microcoleus sp. FACHB-672]MBD2041841.1 PAS domain S-box protein [Microcoleus sp. FACHB-672]
MRQSRLYTLRTKLIVSFLVVALIPLSLLAVVNKHTTEAALRDNANQALFAAASQTATSIDAFINNNLNAVRVEAILPGLATYLSLPASERAGSAEQAMARATLRSLSRKDTVNIFSYALLDLRGQNILDTYTPYIGQDESKSDYFTQPLKTGLPYVSTMRFSPTVAGLVNLYFSSPVRNATGEMIGVLRVSYNATVVQQLVSLQTGLAGSQSFAILLDEHYIHLAHGIRPASTFKSVVPLKPALFKQLQAEKRLPNLSSADELSTNLPDFEKGLKNASTQPYFKTQLTGTGDQINSIAVTPLKTQPWLAVFAQPQAVFLAPIQAQTRVALLLATIIAGAVTIVAFSIAQLLAKPIIYLTNKVSQFTAGNMEVRVHIQTKDEIGLLAGSFNTMAEQVGKLLRGLEQRTTELKEAVNQLQGEMGERVHAQEALRKANEELEFRVEERTAELRETNDQLQAEIAERQRAEEELRKSQQRLSLLFQQTPVAVIEWNTDFEITAWNPAAESIFGYSKNEVMGRHAADLLVQESVRTRVKKIQQALLARAGGTRSTNENITKDGRIITCEWYNTPLIDDSGKTIGVAAVAVDITERKQAEEALQQAEERYRTIFENATEGIFQTTSDGQFLSANPALARIYGYSSTEALVEDIRDINQQIYIDATRRAEFIAAIEKDNAVAEFESQIYRKDGNIIWISENARTVRDPTGNLLYYEGTVVDITYRKVAQEALRYQQEQSELLLLNILPEPIAQRLKLHPRTIADSFEEVTVLFADIVGFTQLSARISPTEIVELLNQIFSAFDHLAEKHGLEKIKTIGDAYMVVGGLPVPQNDHAEAVAEMALDMMQAIIKFNARTGEALEIRVGISTGPVVAGVIGLKKFIYDLWGDTVNTASRMESQGIPGAIQVTAGTYERLRDKYHFQKRDPIQVKGKGEMTTYLLTGRHLES